MIYRNSENKDQPITAVKSKPIQGDPVSWTLSPEGDLWYAIATLQSISTVTTSLGKTNHSTL